MLVVKLWKFLFTTINIRLQKKNVFFLSRFFLKSDFTNKSDKIQAKIFMGDNHIKIFDELKLIRTYIIKLNYERRKVAILKSILKEARKMYSKLSIEKALINEKY